LACSTVDLLAAQRVELTVALMAGVLNEHSAEWLGEQKAFLMAALMVSMLVGQAVYLLAAKSGAKLDGSLADLMVERLVENLVEQ
jgi:hypothetical protein